MLAIKLVIQIPLRSISLAVVLAMNLGLAVADDMSDVQGLITAGKAGEALKTADQLLASKPNDTRLRFQRGVALSKLNRQSEAINVFEKLIEAEPKSPGAYNNLAVLYANQGEYEKARHALELAMRTNPIYATAFQNLGDIYAHLAGQAYKKALALEKSGASLPLKLAVVPEDFESSVDPRVAKAGAVSTVAGAGSVIVAQAPAKVVAPTAVPVATAAVSKLAPTMPTAPVVPSTPAQPPMTVVAKRVPVDAGTVFNKPEPARANTADVEKQAVEKTLHAWAQAWSQRNMESYYAAYASDFKGNVASRKAWEQERRARIVGKKKISVALSDIHVKVSGDKATIRFRQEYRSDALSVKSSKSIEMGKGKGGEWRITAEISS